MFKMFYFIEIQIKVVVCTVNMKILFIVNIIKLFTNKCGIVYFGFFNTFF